MYKHCNTEESARRQRQIELCLLDMMQVTPYAQITIGDICQQVGLSRKSFYRYFGSKDGCLHGLIDHCILDASSAYLSDNSADQSQRRIFECYFAYWKQMHPLLEALCQNDLANNLLERSVMIVSQENLGLREFLSPDNPDDLFERTLFVITGITGLIINWHLSGYQKSPAQMAATIEHLLSINIPTTHKRHKKS